MPRYEGETGFTTLKRLHRLVAFMIDKSRYGAAFDEIAEEIYDYASGSDRKLSTVRRMFNRDLRSLMELYDDEEPFVDEDGNVDEHSVVIEKRRVNGDDRYFINSGFHFIMPMKLTQDQATALACGLRVTEEIVGPFAASSKELWQKIKDKLSNEFVENNNKLMSSIISVIPVGSPEDIGTRENAMRKVSGAIQRGKVIKTSYTHRDGTSSSYLVSPYALFLKFHSWYMMGEARETGASGGDRVSLFRLDRMQAVEELDQDQPRPCLGEDLERLKKDIRIDFDPNRPETEHRVKLRITGSFVKPCLETRWFPGEKKTKQEDGSLLYEVKLKGLEWITLWITRAIDCMEVLEPLELRDEIDRRVDAYCARRAARES